MPNTLYGLSIAYSIVWILLFALVVKIGRDLSRLEKKLSSVETSGSNDL